jgi:diaminohydroxyphosphoribosylaminopyrimidine deaminase/5-amino-6-(5-phosphoribosylamino)uracil reductase
MREALKEAERARGSTSPNPAVGCVIVKAGQVISRGYTHEPGKAHAEIDALAPLGMRAPGATAYVTLEPCNHVGRTGPCTEALIAAGLRRVVCGTRDPNPLAKGGIERLRRAGLTVEAGVLEAECRAVNEAWLHWVTTGRPLVTLKAAVTLDGRLAARGGDSKWVTGEAARREAHRLRALSDAILVGARTVALDDPALTTRLVRGRDPKRVVLDGNLSISPRAKVLPALIVTSQFAPEKKAAALERRGTEIVRVRGRDGRVGRVDLGAMLDALGKRNIQSLLVEGGGEVHGQLLAARLADRLALFIAPKLIGSGGVPLLGVTGPAQMAKAWKLQGISWSSLGDDILVRGSFVW